jgi:hypothetical protein
LRQTRGQPVKKRKEGQRKKARKEVKERSKGRDGRKEKGEIKSRHK